MNDILKFQPGKIILFSEGEYSDFGYCGQVVTLVDCDIQALVSEFKSSFQPKSDWDTPSPNGFVAWLITTQRCAPLECSEVHIGSYGDLNL